MITLAVVMLAVLAYLAGYAITARRFYAAKRPFTEPLNCRNWIGCAHGEHHPVYCYLREGTLIDSATEALALALLAGLAWPIAGLGLLVLAAGRRLVGSGELPGERDARIARMERDAGITQGGAK